MYFSDRGETIQPRSFTVLYYADQQLLTRQSYRASRADGLAADEVALLKWVRLDVDNQGRQETDLTVMDSQLPETIGGAKVVNSLDNDHVIYESGAFRYKVDYSNTAKIIACQLDEGVQELFIPMELNGVRVNCLDLAAVPRQVSTIYLPERVNFDYDSNSTETFECLLVRYMDYAAAKENGNILERAPQMTESDWALSEVDQLFFEQGKLQYKDISVLASQLPETLDGHRCHAAIYANKLLYESGNWIYTLNDDKTEAYIEAVKEPWQTELLLIPAQLDGRPVRRWSAQIAPLCGAAYALMPEGSYPYSREENDVSFHSFSYVTQETLQHSYNREYYEGEYGTDLGNRMYLREYCLVEKGQQQYQTTIEYDLIPTQVEGYELINDLNLNFHVTQHPFEEYTYINLPDGTVAITSCSNNTSKNIIVPARINDKPVTQIVLGGSGSYVFHNTKLTSLKLPATLKLLGRRTMFAYDLKTMELPKGLEEIGEEAIIAYDLKNLTLPEGIKKLGTKFASTSAKTLKLPASLTTLDAYCFSQMDSLTKLEIPEMVTFIGMGAFSEMNKLASLTLPENLTDLPELMAANNPKLTKITIPAAVETIGKEALMGCEKLKTVTFAQKGAQLKRIERGSFSATGLTKVVLPEGVEVIEREAFLGCGKLTSVTIPASVTEIGEYAFEDCSKKLTLTVEKDSYAHQWAQENGFKVKIKK